MDIKEIAKLAKQAYIKTMSLDVSLKNQALQNLIEKISNSYDLILEENKKDLDFAKTLVDEGKLKKSLYSRLILTKSKLDDLIKGIEDLIKLEDPVNKVVFTRELDSDLILKKVTCPIGVIGVIFEARPDCFIQIATLLIKSGNVGILKGGIEAKNTNTIFAKLTNDALNMTKVFPKNSINLIYSREDIKDMLSLDEYIDLIIPRGSNELVQFIKSNTKIPVLGHSSGICHIFVDKSATLQDSFLIIKDAKTQYPSACNAVETLLIHKDFPYTDELLDKLKDFMTIIQNPSEYGVEYSDTILNVKIVNSIDEAIFHINKFSSHHTDSIISKDEE
ncbi:glutamate-5-semialdehyde dehydrogenase, partial [bacterium]|nr:glutamate-5-semialdehyde dehydrogenase [bacterium]